MFLATLSAHSGVGSDSVAQLLLYWGIAPLIGLNLGLAVNSLHPGATTVCAIATLLGCYGWRPGPTQSVDTGYSSGIIVGFILSAVLAYLGRARSQTGALPEHRPPPDKSTVWVVVPTYNEAQNIQKLLSRIRAGFPEGMVLIVDDDSPDGTSRIVGELMGSDDHLRLFTRTGIRGLDSALIAGFEVARAAGATIIVSMDADGSHDALDIRRLVDALEDADVAIGSRYIQGGQTKDWPRYRRVLSRVANAYARSVLGLSTQDCSGGFRAYRVDKLHAAWTRLPKDAGYAFEEAILFLALQHGARFKEIPIIFQERQVGCSKLQSREIWRGAWYLWRLRCGSHAKLLRAQGDSVLGRRAHEFKN
jgi:hypothetical protein